MKLTIDTTTGDLTSDMGDVDHVVPLHSPEAFMLLSRCWLQVGWHLKYSYTFTWMGRPIVQLPEDLIRIQEVIYRVQPDIILETGIAHGGSLVFYASLCKARGIGKVIGIDVHIRPANRAAIEAHSLAQYITILEGSSTDPTIVSQVKARLQPSERMLVILDSCHTKEHVLKELEVFAPLVAPGSYMIAADGIMGDLADSGRVPADWSWNNPAEAAKEFVRTHPEFTIEEPSFVFNEGSISERVTYWPSAYVKRLAG
jgi:cephalosporin hydroxylase